MIIFCCMQFVVILGILELYVNGLWLIELGCDMEICGQVLIYKILFTDSI